MKTPAKKEGEQEAASQPAPPHEKLKTDYPLSEKDEIKQAEEKMRKAAKKKI